MTKIKVGDKVMCSTDVEGVVVKIYTDQRGEQQIMVSTSDGGLYHAPAVMWTRDYIRL